METQQTETVVPPLAKLSQDSPALQAVGFAPLFAGTQSFSEARSVMTEITSQEMGAQLAARSRTAINALSLEALALLFAETVFYFPLKLAMTTIPLMETAVLQVACSSLDMHALGLLRFARLYVGMVLQLGTRPVMMATV